MTTVRVTLTNHKAWVTDCDDATYERLRDYWTFYPDGYRWSPKHKLWIAAKIRADRTKARTGVDYDVNSLPGWNGKILMFKGGYLPAGLFRATKKEAEDALGLTFEVEKKYPKTKPLKEGLPSASEQYSYQDSCADAMCKAAKRGGGVVLAATGTGKTSTTARFFAKVDYDCLFVVDQLDLLYQAQQELAAWLKEDVGVVGDSKFTLCRVTVATRQTLKYHLKDLKFRRWFKSVQIVVVDELHEQMGKTNWDVLEIVHPIARYGLTATLALRKKAVRYRAYAFAGPVLFEFPMSEGIKRDVLTKGECLQLLFPARTEWSDTDSDYHEEYADEVVDNPLKLEAIKQVVKWLYQDGRYIIVLVDRRVQVKRLSGVFREAGLEHKIAFGDITHTKRRQAVAEFEVGDIRLIIASKVFKKGVDIKRVDVMMDIAELKSREDTVQKFGRGVRKHVKKDILLYIDVGTAGKGRYGKRAASRARALKDIGVQVKKVKVESPESAVRAVKQFGETYGSKRGG